MIRQYSRFEKAYYAKIIPVDKAVCFGLYHTDSSTNGEMMMTWYTIANKSVPRLECYDDAWKVLAGFTDVIERLAEVDNKNITQDEFCQILDECNFIDATPYTQ